MVLGVLDLSDQLEPGPGDRLVEAVWAPGADGERSQACDEPGLGLLGRIPLRERERDFHMGSMWELRRVEPPGLEGVQESHTMSYYTIWE
ncbi:MAG TPA: hypothetical protein VKT31_07125 [Solirubrobacteraceae bacterium]|nr:hypothetical protein [Solirubrobacteraceae bacterium]